MTIESDLTAVQHQLTRIADALEAIADSQGLILAGTQTKLRLDLDQHEPVGQNGPAVNEAAAPAPAAKAASKKKKKTSKKTEVGKPAEEPAAEHSVERVREKLKELQLATGSAAEPKSLLKKHGASTLGQLDKTKFKNIIADVDAMLED